MPESRIFKVNEQHMAALAFNEEQPGTPIIFIHGIMSSLNFWIAAENEILRQQPWYALSLPGHYPAAFPAGFHHSALTAELIAQTVIGAVRRLVGDRPVILVGHSTGGFAALAAAACAPESVCGVISISGFAQGKWTGALGMLQRLARAGQPGKALFRQNLKLLASSEQVFQGGFRVYAADYEALVTDPALGVTAAVLYSDFQQLSADAMYAYFRHMPDIDIAPWLAKITAPTLVITGDKDPIVPQQQSRLIARHIPNSELVMLPGAGHIPMSERRELYNAAVNPWLQAHL